MGVVYCVDFGDFIKVGKSKSFYSRLGGLVNEYGKPPVTYWVSNESVFYSDMETIAHERLSAHRINGEKYNCSFQDGIAAIMFACRKVGNFKKYGAIAGIDIIVDDCTGYINATRFIAELNKNGRSFSNAQFLSTITMQEMAISLKEKYGLGAYFTIKGGCSVTFYHPFVFIEFCATIGAKEKMEIYKWFLNDMGNITSIKNLLERNNTVELKLAMG